MILRLEPREGATAAKNVRRYSEGELEVTGELQGNELPLTPHLRRTRDREYDGRTSRWVSVWARTQDVLDKAVTDHQSESRCPIALRSRIVWPANASRQVKVGPRIVRRRCVSQYPVRA
jgi:hypothetical protein